MSNCHRISVALPEIRLLDNPSELLNPSFEPPTAQEFLSYVGIYDKICHIDVRIGSNGGDEVRPQPAGETF